jgi:DNA-binding MarR family transcriptional regulator
VSRRDGETLAASTWLRLMKVHNLILARARRSLAGRCTLPQFDVLAQIDRSEDGLTFRELARHLLVSAGNLTVIVRRLEREGLVRREVVESDRRSYRIVLTPGGRRFIRALIPRHRRDLDRILGEIPGPVLRALRRRLGETAVFLEGASREGARDPQPRSEEDVALLGRRRRATKDPAALLAGRKGGVRARRAG